MGLDNDNAIHISVHRSQDIYHGPSHPHLRQQALVQNVPDRFYLAPIYRGHYRHHSGLGAV